MNTTIAVFTRELREKSRIFFVAAALILIPYIAASVPSVRGQRADAVATLGGAAAAVYGLAVSLALGVSLIGRELTEKRLSFYFAKPLSPLALWSGKALAAVTTILGAMAIIAIPTVLVGRNLWSSRTDPLLGTIVFLCVALFLVSHAVATMVRSRSGWVAVDLVCAVAVAFVAFLLVRQLLIGGAKDAAIVLGKGGAWSVLAVLAVAPVYQLARGRTDIRRSHAALSMFLWPALTVLLLVAVAYVGWVVTAPLSSITQYGSMVQTPSGDWVVVTGESSRAEYFVSYLVNTRTGDKERVRSMPWWGETTSRDGGTLATVELAELFPRRMLVNLRVGPFGDRDKATLIQLSDPLIQATLSRDGSRMAVATTSGVSIYETNSGRMAMSVRFQGNKVSRMYFPSPSLVRIHARIEGGEAIHELDLARRALVKTGEMVTKHAWNSASEDGSRIFLRGQATIVDGRSGALIAKLPVTPGSFSGGAMMNDGRSAVIARDGLHVFDRDGRELRTIRLSLTDKAGIRAQIGSSKLIVGAGPKTMIVDVDRGTVGPTIQNVRGPVGSWSELRLLRFAEDANIAVVDANMKVVLWDVRTGERRPFPM